MVRFICEAILTSQTAEEALPNWLMREYGKMMIGSGYFTYSLVIEHGKETPLIIWPNWPLSSWGGGVDGWDFVDTKVIKNEIQGGWPLQNANPRSDQTPHYKIQNPSVPGFWGPGSHLHNPEDAQVSEEPQQGPRNVQRWNVMVSGWGLGIRAMAAMECYDTDQVLLCPITRYNCCSHVSKPKT